MNQYDGISLTPNRYLGKICVTHPLLKGLRNKSGRGCVRCGQDKLNARRKAHPEKHRAKTRNYSKGIHDRILDELGGRCALCGDMDREVLTIDHIHQDGNKHVRQWALNSVTGKPRSKSQIAVRNDILKQGTPKDKYRVLCFSCNYKAYAHFRRTGGLLAILPVPPLEQVNWANIKQAQAAITKWADATFPHRTPFQALCKLMTEELPELLRDHAPSEYADTLVLLFDMASLRGIDIASALRDKMIINSKRTWLIDPQTGLANHIEGVGDPDSEGGEI